MSDATRIFRQWLETEEALGMDEVPVRMAREPSDVHYGTQKVAESPNEARAAIRAAMAVPPVPARVPAKPVDVRPPVVPAIAAARAVVPEKRMPAPAPVMPAGKIADLPKLSREEKIKALDALMKQIERDSAAVLSDVCTRVVFGEGDPDAALMFVGEGPGAEEDRTGRPFVGRSGQLLDKMIAAIGLKREQVYIGNVVKLRCADWTEGASGPRLQDRPPNPDEVARGLPHLHRQIEIIRPKVIVTLGAPAVKHLTGTTEGVTKIRGTWLSYRGVPVMPTYHPSFVLRAYTEENRRKVWNDLKAALKRIEELSK